MYAIVVLLRDFHRQSLNFEPRHAEAARAFVGHASRIAVLNLADDSTPLGCVSTGSGAAEESVARRTTLCAHLDVRMYPLEDGAGIYSKNVTGVQELRS